jgi:hypothetical protein
MGASSALSAEHQTVGFLSGDQFIESAGHTALRNIRDMIGRSGPASHYNRLDLRARAAICYTAKLRPSDYANKSLDEMTLDEREAIRRAIIEIKAIANQFSGMDLDRANFMQTPKSASPSEAFTEEEVKRKLVLSAQARTLAARAAAITKHTSQGE